MGCRVCQGCRCCKGGGGEGRGTAMGGVWEDRTWLERICKREGWIPVDVRLRQMDRQRLQFDMYACQYMSIHVCSIVLSLPNRYRSQLGMNLFLTRVLISEWSPGFFGTRYHNAVASRIRRGRLMPPLPCPLYWTGSLCSVSCRCLVHACRLAGFARIPKRIALRSLCVPSALSKV